jgi:outer membrane protein TolC
MLGVISLLACITVRAAQSEVLTLQAAVDRALQIAPQLSAQQANVDAAESLAIRAGRLPDPQLIVGVDNLPVSGVDAYSFGADFMTMRKVGVSQQFPRGEKRRLQREQANASIDLARAEQVSSRLDVARETAQAWLRVATAESALADLNALQPELELGTAAARAAVAAGRDSAAHALAAEAASARLKNRVVRQQAEVRMARAELLRWVGEVADTPLGPLPALDDLPVSIATLVATPHLHASILPYEARLAQARSDVALAKAERRPDWGTELSFAKRGAGFSNMVSLQFSVGLPVFASTRQNPVIAARAADVRRIEAERDAELRMHASELQQMAIEWQSLGEQLDRHSRELLPLARERSEVTLAAYRSGRGELQQTLEALEDEAQLLIDRAALQYQRGRDWAALRYLQEPHLHPASATNARELP